MELHVVVGVHCRPWRSAVQLARMCRHPVTLSRRGHPRRALSTPSSSDVVLDAVRGSASPTTPAYPRRLEPVVPLICSGHGLVLPYRQRHLSGRTRLRGARAVGQVLPDRGTPARDDAAARRRHRLVIHVQRWISAHTPTSAHAASDQRCTRFKIEDQMAVANVPGTWPSLASHPETTTG